MIIDKAPWEHDGPPWFMVESERSRVERFRDQHIELADWSVDAVLLAWITFNRSVPPYRVPAMSPQRRYEDLIKFLADYSGVSYTPPLCEVARERRLKAKKVFVLPAKILPEDVEEWKREFERTNGRAAEVLELANGTFAVVCTPGESPSVWSLPEFVRATKVLRRRPSCVLV